VSGAIAPVISLTARHNRAIGIEDQVLGLSTALVGSAGLSPRRETELIQAGNDRLRALAQAVEEATIAAVALDLEERAADEHVQLCSVCSRAREVVKSGCRGLRRIRNGIDRAHDRYRRGMRRLGRT
jgi:hypothetical protein